MLDDNDILRPTFKFSNAWFFGFTRRKGISLRKGTNRAQKIPTDYEEKIRSFHQFIRKINTSKLTKNNPNGTILPIEKYVQSAIANMDQTPLPFDFMGGGTYTTKGGKEVWIKSQESG